MSASGEAYSSSKGGLARPLLGILACLAPWIAWNHPRLWGTDRFFNEVRLVALNACAGEGVLWPDWLPSLAHGHGYPLFHFYPAGLYLAAAPFYAMGLDPRQALLAVLTLGFLVGTFSVYGLLRPRVGPALAWLGGLLWLSAPYLYVNLLVRHAWAELLALSLLPLAIWGLMDLAQGKGGRGASMRAIVGLSLIVLTHNIVALFAAGATVFLALAAWRGDGGRAAAKGVGVSLLLALALTAFFWLPALAHVGEVSADAMSRGVYGFDAQGIHPSQLLGHDFAYGPSVPGPHDLMSLSMGMAQGGMALFILFVACLRRRRMGRWPWTLMALGLILVALTQPFAAGAFEAVPLLGRVQAPFRLLGPLALVVALVIPWAMNGLFQPQHRRWMLLLLVAVVGVQSMSIFQRPRLMNPSEWAAYEPVRQEGVKGIPALADPQAVTTIFMEFLPREVMHYPTSPSEALAEAPPWISIENATETCEGVRIEGNAKKPGAIRLNRFDFLGFEALVNERLVPHRRDPQLGFPQVAIMEPGPFVLEFSRSATGTEQGAQALSILTLFGMLGLALRRRKSAG